MGETTMRKKEVLFVKVKKMEYKEAVTAVNRAVEAEATRIAAHGDYSPEAVDLAETLLAAWIRVQRG
jgi:hypothetical protein